MTIATRPVTWELLRDSGEPRAVTSVRDDAVTTVLGVWFALGMFVDAWAHSNLAKLETFFTPWHAVFYSGFAATAGWILWLVWGQVRAGRRGRAAVPVGYGAAVIALPVFAVSGAGDLVWHTVLGIETGANVFFSPSHLGLVGSMVVILTSGRAAFWAFGALTPFLTWAVFLMISAFGAGRLPTIVEYWTGIPLVAGLLGWLLAALMLPNAVPRQLAAV